MKRIVVVKSLMRHACEGLPLVGEPFSIRISWDNEPPEEEETQVEVELVDPLPHGSVAYAAVRVSAGDIVASLEEVACEQGKHLGRGQALVSAQFISTVLDAVWETRGAEDPPRVEVLV